MTLLIRWDAADTVYISGPPGERYVHFPVEISADVDMPVNVAVAALDPSNNTIVEQSYEGIPVTAGTWSRFSPAILVPDSYFTTTQTWTLRALIYTTSVPVQTPRSVTKSISNTGTGGTARNIPLIILGIGLLVLALGGKRMLR